MPIARAKEPATDPWQMARQVHEQSRLFLTQLRAWILHLPQPVKGPALEALSTPLEAALTEVDTDHARLDLDHLMTMGEDWSHPTQALPRPIAPYDALLEVCARRLQAAEEKGDTGHLRYIYKRLRLARDLNETARLRRVAMALGIPWEDDDAASDEEARNDKKKRSTTRRPAR